MAFDVVEEGEAEVGGVVLVQLCHAQQLRQVPERSGGGGGGRGGGGGGGSGGGGGGGAAVHD